MCLCDLVLVTTVNQTADTMRHIYISLLFVVLSLTACTHTESVKVSKTKTSYSDSFPAAERFSKSPDFSKHTDVKQKKQAFFDFLRPMVREENGKILRDREYLRELFDFYMVEVKLPVQDQGWLENLAKEYRMKAFDYSQKEDRERLLRRVDIIPESLFLAQAANESAWGTSRFAISANNLFGQWCFTKGCGVVPSQRGAGETHEIQKFATVNDAVASYVRNLNSHNAYRKLRTERENLRSTGKILTGYALAIGLERYSARGNEYVEEIRSMISNNRLEGNNGI